MKPNIARKMLKQLEMTIKMGVTIKITDAIVRNCNLKLPRKKAARTKRTVLRTRIMVQMTRKTE